MTEIDLKHLLLESFSLPLPQPIHEILVQAVAKSETEQLIVALKVLGNAGHPASLKPIMKLLPSFGTTGASLPHRVHIDTALALRNMAKKEPKMVQPNFLIPSIIKSKCTPELFFGAIS